MTHAADANAFLFLAVMCKAMGVPLPAYKIITHPGFKKFMEH